MKKLALVLMILLSLTLLGEEVKVTTGSSVEVKENKEITTGSAIKTEKPKTNNSNSYFAGGEFDSKLKINTWKKDEADDTELTIVAIDGFLRIKNLLPEDFKTRMIYDLEFGNDNTKFELGTIVKKAISSTAYAGGEIKYLYQNYGIGNSYLTLKGFGKEEYNGYDIKGSMYIWLGDETQFSLKASGEKYIEKDILVGAEYIFYNVSSFSINTAYSYGDWNFGEVVEDLKLGVKGKAGLSYMSSDNGYYTLYSDTALILEAIPYANYKKKINSNLFLISDNSLELLYSSELTMLVDLDKEYAGRNMIYTDGLNLNLELSVGVKYIF